MVQNVRILLGVCGGIAAYKAVSLASQLTKQGALVDVIMTKSAQQFVTPLTFQTITRRDVYTDTFEERDPSVVTHIHLADHADLVVLAPATANVIGKLANGLADDLLSTTLLACRAPIYIAPAMNGHMLQHPAVEANLETLIKRGAQIIEPASGMLACGYEGKGRLPEPEDLAKEIAAMWRSNCANPSTFWEGKRVCITLGGTREAIDPVRYIGNSSSGKMGVALARVAQEMGAVVTLIAGYVSVELPKDIQVIHAPTAIQMRDAVFAQLPQCDVLIKTAAVADYRVANASDQKIKKQADELTLQLVKNPDILAEVGQLEQRPYLVGFAAETERLKEHAREKLTRKKCDVIVGNLVSAPGTGFGSDQNAVTLFASDGDELAVPLASKTKIAKAILEWVEFKKTTGESK